ncbi:MAG: SCP2 sterol-binding domain-containing protein [Deltaproteobacteria bacterium]|nr:SCP2 sterol-binding domain-containing protein [Deltaproteobacteria bacterium]
MGIKHPSTMQGPQTITATMIFDDYLPHVISATSDLAKKINAVYVFKISGENGGTWTVDLPALSVSKGVNAKADFEMSIDAEAFADMLTGKFDVAKAFAEQRMSVSGNIALLQSFGSLLRPASV